MAQQRSEETRTKILLAAEMLFAQEGYEATGVAEICAEAGVSKGAFYHHFDSKQAVFLQLLNQWLARLDAQMESIRAENPDAEQALIAIASVAGGVFAAAEGRLPIFLEFWTKAIYDPKMWQTVPEQFGRYQHFFADLLCQGMDQGSLRQADPQAVARLVMALAIGMLVQGLVSPEETDWGKAHQDGVAILMRGIQP